MTGADLLVTGIGELATLDVGSTPRVWSAMADRAALAVSGGRFVYVGTEARVAREVRLRRGGRTVDLAGGCVLPGFVDAHTHLIFAGDRLGELRRKVEGASYLDIAREGGGLISTVRATRRATRSAILDESARRLHRMAREG
ncbi:MAG: amidohydrolase family protein, partial [Thermoplasmata archaeon]|nr:amidohydrolase family protein [Thermoplasmata archaeon]